APSRFRGHRHVPATQFSSPAEQKQVVDRIIDVILSSVENLSREDFSAMEWALNEITDNVLTHAATQAGGLVQVTTFLRNHRRVQFIVCDAGTSIPATLRETNPAITSDTDALGRAVKEGVTRDPKVGQGNGLFGTFEVCRKGNGEFQIHSRHAFFNYDRRQRLHVRPTTIPYSGTLVLATIDCSKPGILQEALRFGGQKYCPTGTIETRYESSSDEEVQFRLCEEAESFGSRPAGEAVRVKISNLMRMTTGSITIDFDGVPIVSSSFADEVFGKLFIQLGLTRFMQCIHLTNTSETVQSLIDKAVAQRVASGQ
ncbi:MAG: STAS-like domain-containing protein, partial [Bdellovibrionales bacterium]|nr:STAS-like domain-containing protein [Bdellovibrionales bacterium]